MELLTRNVEKIYGEKELKERLESGEKIKLYLGVDPSGDKLHLGHAIALHKMREFQNKGHRVVLLIGDFTGMIGDPTDRTAVRKPLTRNEVLENAKDYQKQAEKILDFSGKNKVLIKFNSKWLDSLNFKELIELAANFSVQRLLERDMFEDRIKKGKIVHLHEFLYPLMQGYDAVELGVNLQIGGTDQIFNMLAGRKLMQKLKNKEMAVMALPLLKGLDGRKMSKTYDNILELDGEPADMYGKIMSMKDELIPEYFEICTGAEGFEVEEVKKELEMGANPRDVKARLAHTIVRRYHGEKAAITAGQEFDLVFKEKKMPTSMPEKSMKAGKCEDLPGFLVELNLTSSKSEARRLYEQKAVKIDSAVITDPKSDICVHDGMVVQVGRRRFIRIICK